MVAVIVVLENWLVRYLLLGCCCLWEEHVMCAAADYFMPWLQLATRFSMGIVENRFPLNGHFGAYCSEIG